MIFWWLLLTKHGVFVLIFAWVGFTEGGLVGSGTVAEELRAAVGQRLAGDTASRSILGGDAEDSPLQDSQRSSMSISLLLLLLLLLLLTIFFYFVVFCSVFVLLTNSLRWCCLAV